MSLSLLSLPTPPAQIQAGADASAPAAAQTAGQGALPAARAALFGELLRGFDALFAQAAVPPTPPEAGEAAVAIPLPDAALASQSGLPAALHAAVSGDVEADVRERDAEPVDADAVPVAPMLTPQMNALPVQPASVARTPVPMPTDDAASGDRAAAVVSLRSAVPAPVLRTDAGDLQDAAAPVSAAGTHTGGAIPVPLPAAPAAHAADAVVKLAPAAPESWQQPLAEALGERLQMQSGRLGERAVIRLDPPALGRVEIVIQQDAAGGLQVQLSASHGEVLRQLHAIGDTLRQDLVQRQHGDVTVVVADGQRATDGRHGSGQGRQRDGDAPGSALAEADEGEGAARFALASDWSTER